MPAQTTTSSDFYFFTDTDLLNTQITGAYGPIPSTSSPSGKDQFRTTSLHSATGTPKAYAICAGRVLVQEVINPDSSGPDLVNLILKPLIQPPFDIGFIQYYIYKGILKDSLINSVTPTEIAARGNNDLTMKAWQAQDEINRLVNQYYNSTPPAGTPLTPPSSFLGINYSSTGVGVNLVLDDELIDKYFNLPDSEIQLLSVVAGDYC